MGGIVAVQKISLVKLFGQTLQTVVVAAPLREQKGRRVGGGPMGWMARGLMNTTFLMFHVLFLGKSGEPVLRSGGWQNAFPVIFGKTAPHLEREIFESSTGIFSPPAC